MSQMAVLNSVGAVGRSGKIAKNHWKTLASVVLFLVSASALAGADLDRNYNLESVGVLKAWDNVDGLFSDYVIAAYKGYFSRQSRFMLQDLSKADSILTTSKIPYNKLISDPELLAQVARSTHSQSLIRTKIQKEGREYHFEMAWLHSPDMEVMSRQSFVMGEPRDGKGFGAAELKATLEQALDKMIKGVPILGNITGRDGDSVTLNIGGMAGVEPGDTLMIGTLLQVKRHPLLHEIVEWQFAPTGKITIDQVEDRISFGRVTEEEPEHQILRGQKVQEIVHHAPKAPEVITEVQERIQRMEEPPKYGWAAAGLNIGRMARSYDSADGTIGEVGSGTAIGLKFDGQIWFTREWFGEAGINFAFFPYSQSGTGTSISGSSDYLGLKLAAGYQYLVTGDMSGPKGWARLGYHSGAYSLPTITTSFVTPVSVTSLFLGLGADVPLYRTYGVLADFNVGLANNVSEGSSAAGPNQFSGNGSSVSDVSFSFGMYSRFNSRVTFKLTLDGQLDNATFDTGRTLSQKMITIVPSVQYFF